MAKKKQRRKTARRRGTPSQAGPTRTAPTRTAPTRTAESGAERRAGRGPDWTLLGLYLLILLPPFVFLRGVADSFRLPKLVLTGVLALVAVGLLALRLLRSSDGAGADRDIRPLRWTSPSLLVVVPILAVASLGLWTSEHDALVARTLPWLAAGCVFLVGATHLLHESERRRALLLLAWPAAALSFLGLLQAFEIWQPLDFEGRVGIRLGTTSLAGGAFDLSAYLLLPLLLAQERLWRHRALPLRARRRWGWGLLLALFVGGLVATQTLGSLVAAAAGSAAFWLFLVWRRAVPRRHVGRTVVGVAALVASILLVVAPVRERIVEKAEELGRGDVNVFLTGRLDGWRAALWMAEQEPLTGVGTGVFRAEFGDARLALQEEGVTFYAGHRQPYFVNAHNAFLEALAEWGWPGALVALWVTAVVLRGLRRRLRREAAGDSEDPEEPRDSRGPGDETGDETRWAAFLLAAAVSMVVVSLTNFPWRLGLIAFPWLLVVASTLDEPRGAPPSTASDGAASSPARRALAVGLCLLCLLGAVALLDRGRDRIGAQRLVQTVEALALEGARRGALPPRARDLGLDLLRRAREMDPAEVSVPITEGGLFLVAGRLASAERSYREALEMENRPEIWINLARLHLAAGDREAALEAARTAQRLETRVHRKLPEFPELERPRKRRNQETP